MLKLLTRRQYDDILLRIKILESLVGEHYANMVDISSHHTNLQVQVNRLDREHTAHALVQADHTNKLDALKDCALDLDQRTSALEDGVLDLAAHGNAIVDSLPKRLRDRATVAINAALDEREIESSTEVEITVHGLCFDPNCKTCWPDEG